MNKFKHSRHLLYRVTIFLSLLLISSCYDNPEDAVNTNKPPDTHISLFPDSTISKQPSQVTVGWWGDDADGLIVGYYFSWDGINWAFTSGNDSTFALQIGVSDTSYVFRVSSVDNSGNGVFDASIIQNSINYGPEPFIDKNGNNVFDAGEPFTDIGLIDPTPAELLFPIKNSAPAVEWNVLTVLPDTSFAVMALAWSAEDVDGDESISSFRLGLNDTTNSVVTIPGTTRFIAIRASANNPLLMDILIDGLESGVLSTKLSGIQYNANNKLYLQAVDISGAKSAFISLPPEGDYWYVKSLKGQTLILDDYVTADDASSFYYNAFNTVHSGVLSDKYDVWDLNKNPLPFSSTTFPLALRLFKYVFWYSDNNPSLELANASIPKFLLGGGKVFFSILLPQSLDQTLLQGFLPVDSTTAPVNFLFPNSIIISDSSMGAYPVLTNNASIARVRGFYLNSAGAIQRYYLQSGNPSGAIGFSNPEKSLFLLGLPLHRCNGGSSNVNNLLDRVLFEDFGLVP